MNGVELGARRLAARAHRQEVWHVHERAERHRHQHTRAHHRQRDARAVVLVAHEQVAVACEQHVDPRVCLRIQEVIDRLIFCA